MNTLGDQGGTQNQGNQNEAVTTQLNLGDEVQEFNQEDEDDEEIRRLGRHSRNPSRPVSKFQMYKKGMPSDYGSENGSYMFHIGGGGGSSGVFNDSGMFRSDDSHIEKLESSDEEDYYDVHNKDDTHIRYSE